MTTTDTPSRLRSTTDLADRLEEIVATLRADGVRPSECVEEEAAGILDELRSRDTEAAREALALWTDEEPTRYGLALYEHPDTRARVIDRDEIALDSAAAPECDAHGWDYRRGDTVEIDGEECEIIQISSSIQTDDPRGNYVEAIARVR